jgi:hypothetical protein
MFRRSGCGGKAESLGNRAMRKATARFSSIELFLEILKAQIDAQDLCVLAEEGASVLQILSIIYLFDRRHFRK